MIFCIYFNLTSLPASTETLQLFAQFLSRTFKSSQSIKNYLNGVRNMHLLLGYPVEHINRFVLNLSLKGIAKLNPYCLQQSEPITPKILLKMANVLDLSNDTDIVFWCLFLFAFFLLARKSNLVPSSHRDIKMKHYLLREDVEEFKNHLIITMTWTKTIQTGERKLQIPLIRIKNNILCPVLAYKNMCKCISASSKDPLFLLPNKKPITYYQFQSKLRECINTIGLNPQNFSTHSFRRGGATLLFQAGVPAEKIQLQGDWHSDAYKRYLQYTLDDKIEVSKAMTEYISISTSVSSFS